MQQGYKFVREAIKMLPLPLAQVEGKLRRVANSYLPYSTGIEIECHVKRIADTSDLLNDHFRSISNIMDVNIDYGEQRFRIPKGVSGAICLYEICENLKLYSALNMGSGIHYHIDCSDITEDAFQKLMCLHCMNPDSFILKALKSWGYTGKYNSWQVSGYKEAVRFHENYKTVEVRIGEMTFDYELMMKRILHCQNIVRKLKRSVAYTS